MRSIRVIIQFSTKWKVPDGVDAKEELIRILSGLVEHLYPGCEYRINDDYFPFTEPSLEYEVKYEDEWLEILGCGVMHQNIVENNGLSGQYWAFGLGIDRLACRYFEIPDIRYLWSEHPRFLDQFSSGNLFHVKFQPYSELPNQSKDISFWIPNDKTDGDNWSEENEFFDIVRGLGDNYIEEVKLFDKFYNKKKDIYSRAYRITYSPFDPSMNNPSEFKEEST
jgi:phenylalanyl-tRNA synthetase alpha chain